MRSFNFYFYTAPDPDLIFAKIPFTWHSHKWVIIWCLILWPEFQIYCAITRGGSSSPCHQLDVTQLLLKRLVQLQNIIINHYLNICKCTLVLTIKCDILNFRVMDGGMDESMELWVFCKIYMCLSFLFIFFLWDSFHLWDFVILIYFSKVQHSSNFCPCVSLSTIRVDPSVKSVSLQRW